MTIIIIDVETSGLPMGRNPHYTEVNKYDSSRIVQLSFMICNDKFDELALKDYVIKADGFSIENSQFHWITNEISQKQGLPLPLVCNELYKYLPECTHIIAHNANFDINIIKSELYRYDLADIIQELDKKIIICSMKHTMNMVNIRNKYGIKYPSLSELYKFIFNEPLENAHNSKYDVINLHKIIQKLHDKNLLQV